MPEIIRTTSAVSTASSSSPCGRLENGEYQPEGYMLCSTGAHDCTHKGTFKMGAYRVRFSKFARVERYGQYWKQIHIGLGLPNTCR